MLNANHTQRWHTMPTLNADTQCRHSKIYHTFMSAMDSTLAWLLDFFWNSSISSLMLEPISPKFMYMFCNTAQVHVHVLKHKFTYMFWNISSHTCSETQHTSSCTCSATQHKFMYMFWNTSSWTCSETQHTSSCTCSETQYISCIIATTQHKSVIYWILMSHQLRKITSGQIKSVINKHISKSLSYIRKSFLFANQIHKINPYINKHKLQTQIFKELALQ